MAAVRSGAAVQPGRRPSGYYDQARPEIADLVPPRCRRVLDVGCGAGHLGELLKTRGHQVTGVELVPEAAAVAQSLLDAVFVGDVEAVGLPPGPFDAILFADLLEHLVDPWHVLRQAAARLAPGGVIVASIPNVQNGDVVWRLLRGRWDYRERGILDRGHLRFFTLDTIRDLFTQAGLEIFHVGHRYRRSWWREALSSLTFGWARRFFTRQYLVVAAHG
jgi:SAM-dependent methyltransferase